MVLPIAAIVGGVAAASTIASGIGNIIQVGIDVKDNLTPTLETYEGKIQTLEQVTNSWFNGFTRAIPSNLLDGLRSGVDYIRDGLWSAAQMQTSIIASSSELAVNMKIPIGDARKLIESSQVAIANIAAALPGETAGYASIYRSIAGSLSKQFSGDDFTAKSEEFTKRIGILAAIRGVDMNNAGNASNRFLTGTTGFQESMVADIFQNNANLQSNLRDQLAKNGLSPEDWKSITQEARTKVYLTALQMSAPDSLIAEFEGTFQGTVETIKTKIFDPLTGLFGILRQVEGKDKRSVLDAANGILQALKSVGDMFEKLAGGLGVNLDPLYYLIGFFDEITKVVKTIRASMNSVDAIGFLADYVNDLPGMIGSWAVGAIKYLSSLVDRLLGAGLNGSELGKVAGTVMNMFETIKDNVLDNIDVKQLAELYFRISKEIADFQGELWWSSIKIIPTRIANYFSEMWFGFVMMLQPVKVMFVRFAELLSNTFQPIVDALQNLTGMGKPQAVIAGVGGEAVQNSNPIVQGLQGAADATGGLFNKVFNRDVKPLKQPPNKTENKKVAFAPVVNINATTNSSAGDIASMVSDSLNNAFNEYSNGLLT